MDRRPRQADRLRPGDALIGVGVGLLLCALVMLLELQGYVTPPFWLLVAIACFAVGGWVRSRGAADSRSSPSAVETPGRDV